MMCGIVGICDLRGHRVPEKWLRDMTDLMAYRGPDDEGLYVDERVGLAHRRLAIIDLTGAGHQPMIGKDETEVIVYNGEIYNYRELAKELESLGCVFRSSTDTEVILYAYKHWGKECVHRFNGMFAFAVYDRTKRLLFLARDRYGIKPLYWYFKNNLFIFASEIKSILKCPEVSKEVCYPALNEYFTFQNMFSDRTLFQDVHLLSPGSVMTVDMNTMSEPQIRQYWDFHFGADSLEISEEECVEQLHSLFVQAVTRQLVSDVPVGAYLSGGMDSGSIVAVAVNNLPGMSTFTGGFDLSSASGLELGFDERESAETLSNVFKTRHYEVVLHAGDMEWILPELIWHLEDLRVGQCYPNYYVAHLASRFVKVVLSGIGGDELFGGYPWRYYRGMDSLSSHEYFQNYYHYWQRLVSDEDKKKLFSPEIYKQIKGFSSYELFQSVFRPLESRLYHSEDFVNASLYFEFKTFLHGLLLVEDKLSMAHSLETRVPFLDNDLVDFALRIPARYKLRDLAHVSSMDENLPAKRRIYELQTNEGKTVLRKAMSRLIPQGTLERAKQGFSAPDASWFRGESIEYINQVLKDPEARVYEFLQPAYVTGILDEHCSGQVNRRLLIWSLLSFEWWLRNFF